MNKKHRMGNDSTPKVFFTPFYPGVSKFKLLDKILAELQLEKTVAKKHQTAIKLHFGEEGNDTFLRPQFAAKIVDAVKAVGGRPFLTDTTTLYSGPRRIAVSHLELAVRHGFGYETTGAPVVIADGLRSNDWREVKVNGEFFQKVKIASAILDADSLIVLSHFKGHVSAGFGGAIKNLAMGCAPALGKKEQHAARLVVNPTTCISCAKCARNCPVSAIDMVQKPEEKSAFIHKETCIGCAECMTHCPVRAISIDWGNGGEKRDFGCRMAEYAYGAVKTHIRPLFINMMMNITPLCDCVGWSDTAIAPDVGIAASTDPVALDTFCYEKINQATAHLQHDHHCVFSHQHPHTDPVSQLEHAEQIGMGSRSYELITLDSPQQVKGH